MGEAPGAQLDPLCQLSLAVAAFAQPAMKITLRIRKFINQKGPAL